jgi:hypothetical protein
MCASLPARDVRVTHHGASQATLAQLQSEIEPAFDHIYNMTGVADDDAVYLHVIAGAGTFESTARADGVGMHAESVLGYAQPGRRRIVLNMSAIAERGLSPIGVLRHELAHLVMGSQLVVQRPLWFEEGVAQYVESVALNELREAASPTMASFSSLEDLSAGLRQEGRSGAAYMECRELIRLIVKLHGEKAFKSLMDALEAGNGPFETAFEKHCGPLPEFEAAWLEDQEARAGSRLARFFGATFWVTVFAVTAMIIPLAWWLRRRRGKSQVEHWEETEKYFPSDPSWSYATGEDDSFTPPEREPYEPEDPDAWKDR